MTNSCAHKRETSSLFGRGNLAAVFAAVLLPWAIGPAEAADAIAVANRDLRLAFHPDEQRITLSDSRTGRAWFSDSPVLILSSAGASLRAEDVKTTPLDRGAGLRVELSGFRSGSTTSRAKVVFESLLGADGVTFRLEPLENPAQEPITRVDFPRRFGQAADEERGYLILPVGLGGIRPFSRGESRWETRLYANGSHGPNMAFLGKVLTPAVESPGAALVILVHTPFDCGLDVQTRNITLRWSVETGPTRLDGAARKFQLNYPREVQYRLLPGARYVECAKLYRRHLIEQGRFRTLGERLGEQPELSRHLGAVIKKQYERPQFDNGEIARAKELGIQKCVWVMGGWNFGGYDRDYPQRLPPNPSLRGPDGETGEAGLRQTVAEAREAGYVFTLHDNYSDAYENSAEWSEVSIVANSRGERVKGGTWSGGQAWIICLEEQLRFAQRDMPRIRGIIGRGGYFIDVTGAAGTGTCYDPDHPHDHRRSAELKRQLLALAKSEFGVIYTEGIYDFLIPTADGCHKIFIPTGDKRAAYEDVVAVPLLPLVYHDAVILWDLRRSNPARARDPKAPKYLPLEGYVPLYGAMPATLDRAAKEIAESMRAAQLAEMLDHRFLAEGVECTTFADGTRVVANFNDHPYDDAGGRVEAHGYRIGRVLTETPAKD